MPLRRDRKSMLLFKWSVELLLDTCVITYDVQVIHDEVAGTIRRTPA